VSCKLMFFQATMLAEGVLVQGDLTAGAMENRSPCTEKGDITDIDELDTR